MEKRKGERYEDPSGITDRRRTWRFPLFWLFKAEVAAAMRWKHAAVFHAGVFFGGSESLLSMEASARKIANSPI